MSERVLVPEWSGFTLLVPIRTVSAPNAREHHHARASRVRKERAAVRFCWVAARKPKIQLPALVELTRVSPHHSDIDDDNLRGALKAIRDEVAAIAGCGDDPKAPIVWVYQQERGSWAVLVRVVSVRVEPLEAITPEEVAAEGFPEWGPLDFIEFYSKAFRMDARRRKIMEEP